MRPANILYGLEDRPPLAILILSTAQQTAAVAAISFATLITVFDAAHADIATTSNALRVAMLALGIVTMLHCTRIGPVGCNYLVPAVFATSYLPGMLLAARTGGLPLVFGMTIFAGVAQSLMSFAIPRLRPFFPTEITGFVVFSIGLGMGIIGIEEVAGGIDQNAEQIAQGQEALLGLVTLATMVFFSIWTSGPPRTFSVLIGIAVGYLVGYVQGLLHLEVMDSINGGGFVQLPRVFEYMPSFSVELVLPFLVGAIACSLRTIGDVTTAQKLNDAKWLRPDLRTIEGGILASGIGNIIAGLLGSIGSNTASSGVGLSGATGVTARRVGYAMAALLAVLAFFPGIATALAIMPRPVLGAVMIFTGCLVIMNGLQMIMSRVIDSRKTLVIGIALILDIGHGLYPHLFAEVPVMLQPFTQSSVVISISAALLLNMLFRIGVKRTMNVSFKPGGEAAEFIYRVVQQQGGAWGARQDVIQRVLRALSEFAEISGDLVEPGGHVDVSASFDEFRLDVMISYSGRPFEIARMAPTQDELLEDEDALIKLASILIARAADKTTIKSDGDDHRVQLHFDH